jgi:HSP20 family protein
MPKSNREVALLTVAHRVRPSGRLWNPAADVYRSDQGWIVKVDLAGICSDELEIEIDKSSLRIRGCRRDTLFKAGFSYQQMEITYSRFEKTIQFPCSIEEASVAHDYRDGFLIVNLRCK